MPRRKKIARKAVKKTQARKTTKTKSTTRRRKTARMELKDRVMAEIYGVIYLSLSLLTLLSITGKLGVVGTFVVNFLNPIFGWGIYAVPVVLLGVALSMFFAEAVRFTHTKLFGIGLLFMSVLGFMHLSVPLEETFEYAKNGQYGGYIGFVVSFLLHSIIGNTGAYVVMGAGFLISFLIIFEFSISDVLAALKPELPVKIERIGGEEKGSKKSARAKKKLSGVATVDETDEMDINIIAPDSIEEITVSDKAKELMKEVMAEEGVVGAVPGIEEDDENAEESLVLKEYESKDLSEEDRARLEEAMAGTMSEQSDIVIMEGEVPAPIVWEYPPLDLLSDNKGGVTFDDAALKESAEKIKNKLGTFGIDVLMKDVHVGPTVVQYTLKPDEAVKLSKITSLKQDLALALAARAIRIEAPIPGKSLVGIEIPNDTRASVYMKEVMQCEDYQSHESSLKLAIGRDVSGKPVVADLAKMPHLLIAGATGSGKSVGMNSFLVSLLYNNSPQELKLIMIDPKRVELTTYNGIPHLLTKVITNPEKAATSLRWAVAEMNSRYQILADAGHRNIADYNEDDKTVVKMPKIVIVIDELADLMMAAGKEVEASICRLAQMARAVGMHLIIATQRPSVDVITGLIKANIPARIAFTVSSQIDSRTIIDMPGAEDLLGQGDMLYLPGNMGKPTRVQGIFISTKEIERVVNRLKLTMEPDYLEEITSRDTANMKVSGVPGGADGTGDPIYADAVEVVRSTQKASASFLQRRLSIGYNRAARLIELMEEQGLVGPQNGSKPREVLM